MSLIFFLFLFIVLVLGSSAVGNIIEMEHFNSIKERESKYLDLPVVTLKKIDKSKAIEESELICGNVVISIDYFKRFLTAIKVLFGGRIPAYESLLERGRREAVLRMQENARKKEYDIILNMHFEVLPLSEADQNPNVGYFEVFAYGTAVKYL